MYTKEKNSDLALLSTIGLTAKEAAQVYKEMSKSFHEWLTKDHDSHG